MVHHTDTLRELATELFSPNARQSLHELSRAEPADYRHVWEFDHSLGGPSFLRLTRDGRGVYEIADRDVFRPLQYCALYLSPGFKKIEWVTRDVVHMSSIHIESLVKRIGRVDWLPLGQALAKALVRRRVDEVTHQQLSRFNNVYNVAKHGFDHAKDTHMFSVEDALLAYFASRMLGGKLYSLANLATDPALFEIGGMGASSAHLP